MGNGQTAEVPNCFIRRKRSLRVLRNTTRLTRHTLKPSAATEVVRIHHTTRLATKSDMSATEIRVEVFEMVKQKSNRAMKRSIILATEKGFINLGQG